MCYALRSEILQIFYVNIDFRLFGMWIAGACPRHKIRLFLSQRLEFNLLCNHF
jgi:hypothetical protein